MDDETGALNDQSKQYSLVHLMSKCSGFTNQKHDIEELISKVSCAHRYNSNTLFTPEFHYELAGDGIEYSWGSIKRMYWRQPIQPKRVVANFEKLIAYFLYQVNVDMCQRFSSKARRFILTCQYKAMEKDFCDKVNDGDVKPKSGWLLDHNEKIHKLYQNHRNKNTIDGAFIKRVMREIIGIELETEKV